MCSAKFSNQQATSKTDWLSIPTGDTSVYLACGPFEDLRIQIFLAISAISKYMSEDERTCNCIFVTVEKKKEI
jgi:hypothetical protein